MKFALTLLAIGYVAVVGSVPSLPVHPGGIGGLFKGPNSETIIKGPDGSIITSAAEGGEVRTNLQPVIVTEPAVVENVASVEGTVATPAVAPIEAVAIPAPVIQSEQSSDLVGPSGRISTQGSHSVVAGPASTTVTGPAVLVETIVRGPPVVAGTLTAVPPLVTITEAPIAITAAPLAQQTGFSTVTVNVEDVKIVPFSVTGSPIIAPSTAGIAQISEKVISPLESSVQATAGASILPQISVASSSASAHATTATAALASFSLSSTNKNIEVPSAKISNLPVISSTVSPVIISNGGSFKIPSVTVSPLPVIPSNVSPIALNNRGNIAVSPLTASSLPEIHSTLSGDRVQEVSGLGTIEINEQTNLKGIRIAPDQLAEDNRQLTLDPALIPVGNIIPPEIPVNRRFNSRPTDILTTPGLSSVVSATNSQRKEADATLNPNLVQRKLNSQQELALRNHQLLLSNQILNAQSLANPRIVVPNQQIGNVKPITGIPPSNGDSRLNANNQRATTVKTAQQHDLLSDELAKSEINISQLQLTNIPLAAISALPRVNLKDTLIIDNLAPELRARYGRNIKKNSKY